MSNKTSERLMTAAALAYYDAQTSVDNPPVLPSDEKLLRKALADAREALISSAITHGHAVRVVRPATSRATKARPSPKREMDLLIQYVDGL